MNDTFHVALLIETSRGYGRDLTLGIARYAGLHGPWSFHVTPGDFKQQLPRADFWHGDGVFARIVTEEIAEELLDADLPTVAVDIDKSKFTTSKKLSRFTDLRVDGETVGKLAAEHLLERGYDYYGYVGNEDEIWSRRRKASFCRAIEDAGFEVIEFEMGSSDLEGGFAAEEPRLAGWIATLPKPIGIMACNDEYGLHVLDACRRTRALVPQEVGVVGVDNDTLFCELCHPSLSSVSLNGIEGGFRAAAWLEELMKKGRNKRHSIVVEALRVVTRQSTDLIRAKHKGVADAISIINQTKGRGITAESLAKRVKVVRSKLDEMFRDSFGRSVSAEIQRVRFDQARRLLEETDYPIPAIAEAAGYSSASYMIQVFRRELETSPAKYRSAVRSLSVTLRKNNGVQ